MDGLVAEARAFLAAFRTNYAVNGPDQLTQEYRQFRALLRGATREGQREALEARALAIVAAMRDAPVVQRTRPRKRGPDIEIVVERRRDPSRDGTQGA